MVLIPQGDVLLLGAGASFASTYSLPMMMGFFDASIDDHSELKDFLLWFYPQIPREEYNLEELISYLEMSRATGRSGRGLDVENPYRHHRLYDDLISYIIQRLAIPKDSTCQHHLDLLEAMGPTDTLITLNYDLVADQALKQVEDQRKAGQNISKSRLSKMADLLRRTEYRFVQTPPSLETFEVEQGFFLKLHGSLDWLQCTSTTCPATDRIFATSLLRESRGEQVSGAPCRVCGEPLETVIVPPVPRKALLNRSGFSLLWNLALRALANARTLIIIGVSLAPTDFELRWLLKRAFEIRRGTAPDVHIVNPTPQHCANVRLVLGPECNYSQYASLDQFLQARQRTTQHA